MANIKKNVLTRDNTDTRRSMESGVKNASGKPIDEQQRMMGNPKRDQSGQSNRSDRSVQSSPKADRLPYHDLDDCC